MRKLARGLWRNWCGCRESHPDMPPWRGGILAVKSQPRKLKGPEASLLPAHAISTKNKHLLVIYSIPARGFTAAVSVFRGTPPPKPLKCKSVSNHLGARLRSRWADPTGGKPRLSCAIIQFCYCLTSSRRRFVIVHRLFTFRCRHSPSVSGKQKTLLTRGKQGVEILFRFVTCLPPDYPSLLRGVARDTTWIAQG